MILMDSFYINSSSGWYFRPFSWVFLCLNIGNWFSIRHSLSSIQRRILKLRGNAYCLYRSSSGNTLSVWEATADWHRIPASLAFPPLELMEVAKPWIFVLGTTSILTASPALRACRSHLELLTHLYCFAHNFATSWQTYMIFACNVSHVQGNNVSFLIFESSLFTYKLYHFLILNPVLDCSRLHFVNPRLWA
jgi:hypothetical protein